MMVHPLRHFFFSLKWTMPCGMVKGFAEAPFGWGDSGKEVSTEVVQCEVGHCPDKLGGLPSGKSSVEVMLRAEDA